MGLVLFEVFILSCLTCFLLIILFSYCFILQHPCIYHLQIADYTKTCRPCPPTRQPEITHPLYTTTSWHKDGFRITVSLSRQFKYHRCFLHTKCQYCGVLILFYVSLDKLMLKSRSGDFRRHHANVTWFHRLNRQLQVPHTNRTRSS